MSDRIITGIDVGTYQVKVVIVRIPKSKNEQRSLKSLVLVTLKAEVCVMATSLTKLT